MRGFTVLIMNDGLKVFLTIRVYLNCGYVIREIELFSITMEL